MAVHHLARSLALAIALILGVEGTAVAQEQEYQCLECEEDEVPCWWTGGPCDNPNEPVWAHRFPVLPPCDGPGGDCRACGVTSFCHVVWDQGPCHEECVEHLAMAIELHEAISTNDARAAAALVAARPELEFDLDRGVIRILATSSCSAPWMDEHWSHSPQSAREDGVPLDPAFARAVAIASERLRRGQ
jgi:hypothetical protein